MFPEVAPLPGQLEMCSPSSALTSVSQSVSQSGSQSVSQAAGTELIPASPGITKLLWSNTPSLLEPKLVLEQHSNTFCYLARPSMESMESMDSMASMESMESMDSSEGITEEI